MKKHKWGIERKLLFWLGISCLVVLLLLGVIVNAVLHDNEERRIAQYMTEQLEYFNAAVRQELYFAGYSADPEGFARVSSAVAEKYLQMIGNPVNCYAVDGECVYASYEEVLEEDRIDIDLALEGQNAYTVAETRENTQVYGSLRVVVDDEYIGIMRVNCDYTEEYQAMQKLQKRLLWIAAALMLLFIAVMALFVHYMIAPVKRLSAEITKNIAEPEKMIPLPATGPSEIGELTTAYNRMIRTIGEQLVMLEKEQENLRQNIEYRKSFYDHLTHELKTPVTIILGYAEMMEQTDLEDREFAKKGVNEIICEGKRLREMLTGLLEESRSLSEPSVFEEVELREMILQICESMDIKARRYMTRICPELCEARVQGDPHRLRQLFVNLLDNAIKYGVRGEDVTVEMRETETSILVCVRNAVEPDTLDDVQKIFTPFYRSRRIVEREEGSVGLGLAICRNVARDHGAELTARQEDGFVEFCVKFEKERKGVEK